MIDSDLTLQPVGNEGKEGSDAKEGKGDSEPGPSPATEKQMPAEPVSTQDAQAPASDVPSPETANEEVPPEAAAEELKRVLTGPSEPTAVSEAGASAQGPGSAPARPAANGELPPEAAAEELRRELSGQSEPAVQVPVDAAANPQPASPSPGTAATEAGDAKGGKKSAQARRAALARRGRRGKERQAPGKQSSTGAVAVAIAAVAVLCVVLLFVMFNPGANESGTVEKRAAGETPTSGKARSSDSQIDQLLVDYDQYEKAHPDDYAELQEKLRRIETRSGKSEAMQSRIQKRHARLFERHQKYATALAEELGSTAMKQAREGDIEGAWATLDRFPESAGHTDGARRIPFFRSQIKKLAQGRRAVAGNIESDGEAGDPTASLAAAGNAEAGAEPVPGAQSKVTPKSTQAAEQDAGKAAERKPLVKIAAEITAFNFKGALTKLKAAKSAGVSEAESSGLLEQEKLVGCAEQAFLDFKRTVEERPVNAELVRKTDEGEYTDVTPTSITLNVRAGARKTMKMVMKWAEMPADVRNRLTEVVARGRPAEMQVKYAAWAMLMQKNELAARILRLALLKSPSVMKKIQTMGSEMSQLHINTLVLMVEFSLREVEALAKNGHIVDARQGLLDFKARYPSFHADPNMAARVRKLSDLLVSSKPAEPQKKDPAGAKSTGKDKVASAAGNELKCPICEGGGHLKKMGCKTCRRLGRVSKGGQLVRCKSCGGDGAIKTSCPGCPGVPRPSCGTCKGAGFPVCRFCGGKGSLGRSGRSRSAKALPCSNCEGTGFYMQARCMRCNQTGKVGVSKAASSEYYVTYQYDCPLCSGKGRSHPICHSCKGNGSVGSVDQPQLCASCLGTGKRFEKCKACAGSGQAK